MWFWGLNSGLHAYRASVLSTELCLYPPQGLYSYGTNIDLSSVISFSMILTFFLGQTEQMTKWFVYSFSTWTFRYLQWIPYSTQSIHTHTITTLAQYLYEFTEEILQNQNYPILLIQSCAWLLVFPGPWIFLCYPAHTTSFLIDPSPQG